jgi:hypothetical protein
LKILTYPPWLVYVYAIYLANATFAFTNLSYASNLPTVKTAATRVDPGGICTGSKAFRREEKL